MTISNGLLTSLLAMDSYNRGENPGIAGLGGAGSQIGTATLLNRPVPDGSSEAGFSASAYSTSFGTVISYRGTDNPGFFASANGPSDIVNGWIAGVGVPTSQVSLAIEFYKTVTGTTNIFGGAAANTILTGHSLGGGLAGMVAALTGTQAQIYDHMPFGLAA